MKAKGVKEVKEDKEDKTIVPPRQKLLSQLASRPSIGVNLPINPALSAHIPREYAVVVDRDRKYVQVSDSFCKLLGYRREELIGRKYDDVTTPGTNDIPTVSRLLHNEGYMHGIWVFAHRKGTRILVRYEAWVRPDGLTECNMDLLGAGA
jgi:PAS domain S-box-containing protein